MFKKAEIVNVQLEDAVPETSYLHSKYWTKYCGRYRLPLVAYNFLSEYFRTHTEFKVTMPGFGSSSDWYDDKDAHNVTFYQRIEMKDFSADFPVLSWDMRACDTGIITVCYYNAFCQSAPTREQIYNYVDYYKKHKNPMPYGFENRHHYTKEVRTEQIWIEDFSDLDKVIDIVRPYAKQQKEELIKYAAMFTVLEETEYTEKMEAYKKQIADLNKMRNDFTDKTVDSIFKQINLQGDF